MYHRFQPLFDICRAIEAVKAIKDMEETTDAALIPLQKKLDTMVALYRTSDEQVWKEFADFNTTREGLMLKFYAGFLHAKMSDDDIKDFDLYVLRQYVKYSRICEEKGVTPIIQYHWERHVAIEAMTEAMNGGKA